MATSSRSLKPLLIAFFLVLLTVLARGLWLPWLGQALVQSEQPAKADLAVVLAGDFTGHRIEEAAGLVQAAYVPAVLVDGSGLTYGTRESDLAIAFIVREGYPEKWFIPLPMSVHSTREEAATAIAELERRHIASFLLITSNFHTARAARIFRDVLRKRGDRLTMRVVAAPDEFFQPASWWRNREARKTVLLEWSKTIAEVFGL